MSAGTESGLLNWIRKTFQGYPKKKVLPPEDIQKYVEEKLSREQIGLYEKAPIGTTAPIEAARHESPDALPDAMFAVPASMDGGQPAEQKDREKDLDFSAAAPLLKKEQKEWVYCATKPPVDYQMAARPRKKALQEKEPLPAEKSPGPVLVPEEEKGLTEATIVINRRLQHNRSLELDESFQQMLFREIDSRGMTDVECYQRAHMDRKTFSKIRGNIYYKPKKETAVALALALKMTVSEAQELLRKAGYAFSDSNVFDVVVMYFFEKRQYDLFEINETLYYYDQPLLGAW